MAVERLSPCKVNLLLNILGRRSDGYHALETVTHPVGLCDRIEFDRGGSGVRLTCSRPDLPVDGSNLVVRAAELFCAEAGVADGVRLHPDKQVPLAAGLGGGSGNAATTLLGLNALFDHPLSVESLTRLAAQLGSDVPFFLQAKPALATGRGEQVQALDNFPALDAAWILLIHPGFGISTAWAYQNLGRFPVAINGRPGRAQELVVSLQTRSLAEAATLFYNSLEAPAFEKFPVLALYQEHLRDSGAAGVLMSGSGSTTFALTADERAARALLEQFQSRFGTSSWTAVLPIAGPG